MHKAGGLIALIAGFFSIAASFFVGAFTVVVPDPSGPSAGMYLVGGLFVSAVVIVLSAIILNTQNRLPALLLVAFSVLAISQNWGSGFVTICLVFAILGGLMASIWR